jgi:hypothetical protein
MRCEKDGEQDRGSTFWIFIFTPGQEPGVALIFRKMHYCPCKNRIGWLRPKRP